MKIKGKIKSIYDVVEVTTKKGSTIKYRDIVLDTSRYDQYTGDIMPTNLLPIRFLGDKMEAIQGNDVGDMVEVDFYLQGVPYQNGSKIYVTIRGLSMKRTRNDSSPF